MKRMKKIGAIMCGALAITGAAAMIEPANNNDINNYLVNEGIGFHCADDACNEVIFDPGEICTYEPTDPEVVEQLNIQLDANLDAQDALWEENRDLYEPLEEIFYDLMDRQINGEDVYDELASVAEQYDALDLETGMAALVEEEYRLWDEIDAHETFICKEVSPKKIIME